MVTQNVCIYVRGDAGRASCRAVQQSISRQDPLPPPATVRLLEHTAPLAALPTQLATPRHCKSLMWFQMYKMHLSVCVNVTSAQRSIFYKPTKCGLELNYGGLLQWKRVNALLQMGSILPYLIFHIKPRLTENVILLAPSGYINLHLQNTILM